MASLYVVAGNTPVRHYSLEKEQTVLGRSTDCDVVIPSICVDRMHARIIHLGDQFYVEDMNSRGGTRINGPEIRNQIQGRKLLRDGDQIWFGSDIVVQFQE